MKLIIDIPKGTYEAIKVGFINQVLEYKVWNAIKDGTPLDSVQEKIAKLPDYMFEVYELKSRVLHILDNIGKESEVKPNE